MIWSPKSVFHPYVKGIFEENIFENFNTSITIFSYPMLNKIEQLGVVPENKKYK